MNRLDILRALSTFGVFPEPGRAHYKNRPLIRGGNKPTDVAQAKRAAAKRNNIRKRSGK